ncbi:sugar phosphate isomerase/epimerase family protein [Paludisphaera mucosa]|uniref:Sugar phosphate isomerase/epimerase n=1 Tax=Paludisphaera mucosa TaxID=3030827 RepID=A0ABT6F3M8_9BACT|nr:sugar phosphate isomerase/epimerase family protein [Paludisphaera mucosa]MDG3002172.1 sugar phosphate isomerase/epimerase [Paludisphaera mucosa]
MTLEDPTRRPIEMNRRAALAGLAGATLLGAAPRTAEAGSRAAAGSFILGLNTATIRGQKLGIVEIVDIVAKAGYQGLEPWLDEIHRYKDGGGSLEDLGKRLRDAGVSVESAIDFFEWGVDDPERRRNGLEAARRSMETLQKIGAKRVAAPASGATDAAVEPARLAERYRALLELGDQFGIVPEVEVWGFSKTLGTLAEAAYVAIASGHPRACILPDVYHLHRGGSSFEGLKLLGPAAIPVFHFNDYPAAADRTKLNDSDRVYPGDGVAPIPQILETLAAGGFRVMLSLEVFNKAYWAQDPAVVAATGARKMKALVDAIPSPTRAGG